MKLNKSTKKTIAKEGLIFLGIALASVLVEQPFWWCFVKSGKLFPLESVTYAVRYTIPFLYLSYLIAKFIIWAVKTLKEK